MWLGGETVPVHGAPMQTTRAIVLKGMSFLKGKEESLKKRDDEHDDVEEETSIERYEFP